MEEKIIAAKLQAEEPLEVMQEAKNQAKKIITPPESL